MRMEHLPDDSMKITSGMKRNNLYHLNLLDLCLALLLCNVIQSFSRALG